MKTILMFAASFLLLASCAFAQESQSADDAAVKRIVQYYFDGWTNNDVASLKKAFNPKAKWFYQTNTGELAEIKINTVFENTARNAQDKAKNRNAQNIKTLTRILTTDVTGDTALVKIELEFPDAVQGSATLEEAKQRKPGIKRTEYLSLYKFTNGWQIVSKTFVLQSTNANLQQSVSAKQ